MEEIRIGTVAILQQPERSESDSNGTISKGRADRNEECRHVLLDMHDDRKIDPGGADHFQYTFSTYQTTVGVTISVVREGSPLICNQYGRIYGFRMK